MSLNLIYGNPRQPIDEAQQHIPEGTYCYKFLGTEKSETGARIKTELCPYADRHTNRKHQDDGYCHLLAADGVTVEDMADSLLWDSVKECGINEEISDPDEEQT